MMEERTIHRIKNMAIKISIVEDSAAVRASMINILEGAPDCEFIGAFSSGEEALLKIPKLKPQVVLMDISLPVMNGWEVTRLLKTNGATKHIPIIALTAHALVTDREKAFEAGCDDYDTKPVEFNRLNEKIDNLLVAKKVS